MTDRAKTRAEKIARVAASLLATAVAVYAAQLLIVGQTLTVVQETPIGGPPGQSSIGHAPYPAAILPLSAAILILSGLLVRRLSPLAWVGSILLFVFSLVFLFSSGAFFLLFAVPLGALLILMAVMRRSFA